MGNWTKQRWGDIATLEYGKALRNYENFKGNIPVYGTNGAIGWCNEHLYPDAGVIIGRKGAYRGVHYSKTPFFVIDTAFYLKPKPNTNFDMKWAYYQLLTQDINSMDSGSAIPSTSRESFYNLQLLLPPIEEQKAIVRLLDTLNNKIELNQQMNKTLEAIERALYKALFIDFEFDNFAGNLTNDLPESWNKVRLEELIESVSITHKFPTREIIFLNTSDILDGQILNNKYVDVVTLPGQAKKSIKKNDILYSEIRPANKRHAFIDFDADDYVVSTKLMVLRAKSFVDPLVIYYFLKSDEVVNELQTLAESRSGTFPQITFQQIKNLKMIVPTEDILKQYTKSLRALSSQIRHNNNENKRLADIRDSLLPKLISGEIPINSLS